MSLIFVQILESPLIRENVPPPRHAVNLLDARERKYSRVRASAPLRERVIVESESDAWPHDSVVSTVRTHASLLASVLIDLILPPCCSSGWVSRDWPAAMKARVIGRQLCAEVGRVV